MRAIRVIALVCLLPLVLSGCVHIGPQVTFTEGGPREFAGSFDVSSIPASIRSAVASDFPGYHIIDASVDDQDALMTLRSSTTTFTLDVDYRNPKAYDEGTGPYYYCDAIGDMGELDMRDTKNPQVSSIIAFFASRYPLGDYVFQGTSQEDPEAEGQAYTVGVYRMHIAGTSVPQGEDAPREQTWRYDPITKSWSVD